MCAYPEMGKDHQMNTTRRQWCLTQRRRSCFEGDRLEDNHIIAEWGVPIKTFIHIKDGRNFETLSRKEQSCLSQKAN